MNDVLKFPVEKSIDCAELVANPYQNVNTDRLIDKNLTNTNITFQTLNLGKKFFFNNLRFYIKFLIHTHNYIICFYWKNPTIVLNEKRIPIYNVSEKGIMQS